MRLLNRNLELLRLSQHGEKRASLSRLYLQMQYLSAFRKNYFLIRDLQSQRKNHLIEAIDNQDFLEKIHEKTLLVPTDRADGVGIQFLLRASILFLAQQVGAVYIHLPFSKVAHQQTDLIGRHLTPQEWAKRWEHFFCLGLGHPHLTALSQDIGTLKLACLLSLPQYQFHGYSDEIERIPSIVNDLRKINGDIHKSHKLYVFGLGLCQASQDCQLAFDHQFIESLRSKYAYGNYQPTQILYDDNFLNIAIHIRRGDAWDNYHKGKTHNMFKIRILDEKFYIEVIKNIFSLQRTASKPICFHIFTDGQPENFNEFAFNRHGNACLNHMREKIENIVFHFDVNAFDTLYHLINAPILIPGKSSFGVVAALLNPSFVGYTDEILDFYQYNLLRNYLQSHPKWTSLNDSGQMLDMISQA